MRVKSKLNSDNNRYTYDSLKDYNKSDLKAEFKRLANIMNKNIENIENSKHAKYLEGSEFYKYNKDRYNIGDINKKSKTDLKLDLIDLSRNLNKKENTANSLYNKRKDLVKKFNKEFDDAGVGKIINQSNLNRFLEFSDWLRSQGISDLVKYYAFGEELKESLSKKESLQEMKVRFTNWIEDNKRF